MLFARFFLRIEQEESNKVNTHERSLNLRYTQVQEFTCVIISAYSNDTFIPYVILQLIDGFLLLYILHKDYMYAKNITNVIL